MADNTNIPAPKKMGTTEILICIMAAIGFAFDIYVLLVLPPIVRPALLELAGIKPGSPEFLTWVGRLLYIPAFVGGFFGLIGGYLTDLFGRRRILTFSILLYAISAAASGFSTSVEMLLFFRCTTFIGVCVEFVAAVAWLAELFPNPKQREAVLGFTQAFSSLGGILVAASYALCVKFAADMPAVMGGHEAWRYTFISGVLPALPLIFIRPFLPESPEWERKSKAGTLKRPSIAELFSPELRQTTIVTTIMFACAYGAAFGAIQHLPNIVPGLAEVASTSKQQQQLTVSAVQGVQELGGLTGRFILAGLAIVIVSRRKLIRIFQIPGLFLVPWVFCSPAIHDLGTLKIGIFFAGLLTVAQFSFWGNYLPRVYPMHLRGTGEGFAANIGGRMIGTSAALVTTGIASSMPGNGPSAKLAYAASAVAFGVYLIGFIASFWLPEPGKEEIAD